ncbi:MAG: efflux RND transporter periplasmic adaptor subunit [Oceanospirillaceae bacterium]|nr:efflux RND transporter periplasmic adaptor subunit [Oceanospirillaceae bacterium]
MKNSKKIIRPLGVVLVAVAAVGVWWYQGTRDVAEPLRLVLYGNIDIREADLAFNNSEHVAELLVQEGARVHKGQLLATLHSERMEAEVEAAKARVASRRAVLARLEAGSRPEEILQAKADVAAVNARLIEAQATYRRTETLYRNHDISRQALDSALAARNTARAELKVSQEALALAVAGPRQEDIDEARAMLKADEAQLVLVREVLKDASLYAPFDGVIRNRILEPGDMVTPQTPVFTLARTSPLWVRAYVPESSLGKLVPGMAASVSTDSYPDKEYRAWIGYISPTAEFTPKNVETPELRTRLVYQVRIHVCNPNDELRLGMPATVAIDLGQPRPGADCSEQGAD